MKILKQSVCFRSPSIFEVFPMLIAAESTRHGGISQFPYASLNLGLSSGDEKEAIHENRRVFFESLGILPEQFAASHQVHGNQVRIVTQAERTEGYDALVTNVPGVFVGVTVADCTPILIYDAKQQAVGAAHAGWRGTVAEIVIKTLETMQQAYGTQPSDCYAYVGTCIDECAFEVGEEVAVHFDEDFKRFDSSSGKFLVDLKKANASQLVSCGVPLDQIEVSPYSTVTHNEDYFSYRLEKGKTGRMLAVIGMK